MAVAYVASSIKNVAPATGSSFSIASVQVSGTNPILMLAVILGDSSAVVSTSTKPSWNGSTLTQASTVRSTDAYVEIWYLVAPAAATASLSVTLSASVPYQAAAACYSGADQSTGISSADTVTSTSAAANSMTLTPSNLTSSDGSFGGAANTVADNPNGVSTNDRFKNGTTSVNIQVGDSAGTTALTANWDGHLGRHAGIGVRILVAGAGGGSVLRRNASLNGLGAFGKFFHDPLATKGYCRRDRIYVPARYVA